MLSLLTIYTSAYPVEMPEFLQVLSIFSQKEKGILFLSLLNKEAKNIGEAPSLVIDILDVSA